MSALLLRMLGRARLVFALVAVMVSVSLLARASEDEPTIALKIEGKGADSVRERIAELVPKRVTVVEEREFNTALSRGGLPYSQMGKGLTTKRERPRLFRIVRKALVNRALDGAILGRIREASSGKELALVYLEPQGEPVVDATVPLTGDSEDQEAALETALAPAFERLTPKKKAKEPVEEEAKPNKPSDGDDEEAEQRKAKKKNGPFVPSQPGSEVVSVELGLELAGRFFSFRESEGSTTNLRPYSTFGAPAIYLAGEIYPAATTRAPFIHDLGIVVAYSQVFSWSARSEDDQYVFDTSWNRFWVGLRYRFPIGEDTDRPVVIGLSGRFGLLNMIFEPGDAESEQIQDEVPQVEYLFLRGGLDAYFPLGAWVALIPSIDYAGPLRGGTLYDRFTDASLAGINASLTFALLPGKGSEIRLAGEYTAVFSSFASEPTDQFIADGAADHFVSVRLGAGYRY